MCCDITPAKLFFENGGLLTYSSVSQIFDLVSERASDPSPTRYSLQHPRKDCRGRWGILNKQHPTKHSTSFLISPVPVKHSSGTMHSWDFPTKATFIDAVRNGNYSTWPKLMLTLINHYFPDSDKTIKGHLKGQRQGIGSTKQVALEKIIENKEVRIKIESENSPFHQIPITKTHEAFFRINYPTNSIHTNQTGAFPFTSQ